MSKISRVELEAVLDNAIVKPKDIHSLWLLLRFTEEIVRNTADTIGRDLFVDGSGEEVIRLAELGSQLGLFASNFHDCWSRTAEGKNFASLSHWRRWKPCAKALEALGYEAASAVFIGPGKLDNRPFVIDLFAGVGGLSLAFEAAGFEVKVAVDNDRQACEAHEKNFPDCKVIRGDINEIAARPVELLCASSGIDPREVSGVIGGPPCQGFSYMGERASNDERNLLTSRFMDVVMEVEPHFFVMENVVGLLNSGVLPKFGTHVRRLGKSIGGPATRIVECLPEAKVAVAKRDRQFRKRTVSQAITAYKLRLSEEIGDTMTLDSGVAILVSIFSKLPEWLKEKAAEAYLVSNQDRNGHEAISSAINCAEPYFAQLSIGLFVDILMDRNLLSDGSAEGYLKTVAKAPSVPAIIKNTITKIAEEYDAAPTSEEYEGVAVGPIVAHLIQRASEKYQVAPPRVLNAAWYGTPQNRQRLFLVGIHKRLGKSFSWPERKFLLPGTKPALFDLPMPTAPTVFDAIGDLPDIDSFRELHEGDQMPAASLSEGASDYAKRMRLERMESSDFALPRPSWNPFVIDCCNRTIHTGDVIERLKQTPEGVQEETSHKTRLNRAKVSHTLRAGTREGKGSHTAVRPVHYEHHRVISVREGARLMGYPDWMTFHRTKWHGFRLVGNGVPFQLGNEIAREIIQLISPNPDE